MPATRNAEGSKESSNETFIFWVASTVVCGGCRGVHSFQWSAAYLISANFLFAGALAVGQETPALPDAPSASQTQSKPSNLIERAKRHEPSNSNKGVWRGARCAWPPGDVEEGCGQSTPQCAPHIQGLRSPPDKKIASAAVITTRSNRALSRLKSTTEANNSASTRIRVTLVIVVINSSLRSRHDSESRHLPCA